MINVKNAPFNAAGNGIADDRAAIQAAIDAAASNGGGCVFFPNGVYAIGAEPGAPNLGGLQIKDKVTLQGEAAGSVVLKLINGTNRHLIYGPANVTSLWGSSSSGGVGYWSARDLQLDGNRVNDTSGSGIWVYGYKPLVENLFIRDVAEHAWRTEWGDGGPVYGMEGTITNVHIDRCGKHGMWFSGPHDSILTGIIVIDASQATHNTYDAFHLSQTSASRFVTCHAWARSTVTNRMRHALYDGTGSDDFIGCHFEGAYSANVVLNAQSILMDGCRIYAAGNGVNLLIRGTENVVKDTIISDALSGSPAVKGVVLGQSGDWVAGCDIDVFCRAQAGGAVDFTYSSGNNSVRVRGYNPTGTFYVGTPPASDEVDLYISGGGGGTFRQLP